jgi:DNA repair protein RecN (Recombination protein N)
MLLELHIENFAIIDQLDVQLGPGLIAFTGETGAGKSIIIDAVETLLGGRADATLVRSGAERASIEGSFRIPSFSRAAILAILEREDLVESTDLVTLAREIRLNGRSIARVNGHSVNAGLLRELGEYLIDVHGQSEHLSLLRVSQHLGLLDSYAMTDPGSPIQGAFDAYSQAYKRLNALRRELEGLRQAEREAARRADLLNFQIKEIEAARLRPGEEEELRDERNRLANAEELALLAQQAIQALDEGAPDSPAVTDLFGQVVHALTSLARLDAAQSATQERTQALLEELSDLARGLRAYLEGIEFNPKRLDQVEERLSLIHTLKRKYGDTIPVVLQFLESAQRDLETITHAGERILELEAEQAELLHQLGLYGERLSSERHTAADRLGRAIENELNDLNMSGAQFRVDFQTQPDPDGARMADGSQVAFYPFGLERIEFLIAPNPGEGFKPLAKIASGGETSRLMLALKNVLVKADHLPTLIFDEIDQGIGGRVGAIVGEKLWLLARQHQVLCITHLPQLAAFGEQHFHVEKLAQAGRTITQVRAVQGDDRLVELALMLGDVSEGTLHSARELLRLAEQRLEQMQQPQVR